MLKQTCSRSLKADIVVFVNSGPSEYDTIEEINVDSKAEYTA